MLKKMIFRTAICLGLFLSMQQNCIAQAKTKDELKAEREVLKAEMNSKEATERRAKFEKLEAPKTSNVASIDQIAVSSAQMLISTKEINAILPEMYKRTIGETVDGVTDVTVKKPTLDELLAVTVKIASIGKAIIDSSTAVASAAGDITSASPLQIPKATKSLNFSKDVLALVGPELKLSLKMVNNLIETLNTANNN